MCVQDSWHTVELIIVPPSEAVAVMAAAEEREATLQEDGYAEDDPYM